MDKYNICECLHTTHHLDPDQHRLLAWGRVLAVPFAAFQDPHLEKAASPRRAAGTAGITLDEHFCFVVTS